MIVVTTPTGQIGAQLLDRLLDRADGVRVVSRTGRLPAHLHGRVEVARGSHRDVTVLSAALRGADSLLWLVPPNPLAADVEQYYLDFTRSLLGAVKETGIEWVVGISTIGREYERSAGHLSAALAMDATIEAADVGYRALRMPFYMENLLHQASAIRHTGTFFVPNSLDRVLLTVATRDIAAAAATVLLDRSWSGQDSVPIVGPDDLTPREMAAVVSDVLQREVHVQHVPAVQYLASMTQRGMSDAWVRGLLDMAAAQDDGIYAEAAGVRRAPTGFREWCSDTLKPAVDG